MSTIRHSMTPLFFLAYAVFIGLACALPPIDKLEDLVARVKEDDSQAVSANLQRLVGEHSLLTKAVCEMSMGSTYELIPHSEGSIECHKTILHFAAAHTFSQIIRRCHAVGANLDVRSSDQCETPLFVAHRHQRDMVYLLLALGADANARDAMGRTLLHRLMKGGDYELAEALITQFKSDPDLQNVHGNTALHEAVRYMNMDIAKMLIKDGKASYNIQNLEGRTPLNMTDANSEEAHARKRRRFQKELKRYIAAPEGRFSQLLESPRQKLRSIRRKSQ